MNKHIMIHLVVFPMCTNATHGSFFMGFFG